MRHSFWEREIAGVTPAFPIRLQQGMPTKYYVRILHYGSLRFEARLWELNEFNQYANRTVATYLFLSGALLTLALYNLCVFAHLWQRSYLWLSLFLAALNFNLMATSGTANMLLWPEPSWFSINSMSIINVLTLCMGIGFYNEYMRHAPRARIFTRLNTTCGLIAVLGVIGTFFNYPSALYFLFLGGILTPVGGSILAVNAILNHQRYAKSFLACWGLMLMGAIVTCLIGPGFIPATPFAEHFIFFAALTAAIGWSFTLTSQVKARIREQQDKLEHEVSEQTKALRHALEEVETLHRLLPICCSCKKIRDNRGAWQHVEAYIQARASVNFSHGLCPDCASTLYPDYVKENEPQA